MKFKFSAPLTGRLTGRRETPHSGWKNVLITITIRVSGALAPAGAPRDPSLAALSAGPAGAAAASRSGSRRGRGLGQARAPPLQQRPGVIIGCPSWYLRLGSEFQVSDSRRVTSRCATVPVTQSARARDSDNPLPGPRVQRTTGTQIVTVCHGRIRVSGQARRGRGRRRGPGGPGPSLPFPGNRSRPERRTRFRPELGRP